MIVSPRGPRRFPVFWSALAMTLAVLCALPVTSFAQSRGELYIPPQVSLPAELTLDETLRIFRSRGIDLLIADATVLSAQGDVQTAAAIANPNLFVQAGPTFNYSARSPCSGCEQYYVQWGISDNAAVVDFLSGKRGLRVKAARSALEAAKLARVDAERNLESQVKQQYIQVVAAAAQLDFSREVQSSLEATVVLNRKRFNGGAINEGDLARVEVQKGEADQAVDTGLLNLRQAKVGLAFLLGVRADVPQFDVERRALKFAVPGSLNGLSEQALLRVALENRPDLKQYALQRERAAAALNLAKRQQFPDIALSAQYSQLGQGQAVGQPMSVIFGVTLNLPVFYQQQGEIRRATADLDTQALTHAKTGAQVINDVGTAFAAYYSNRELVERMESIILRRSKTARDIIELQFKNGAATLMDFLDAERTYIATNTEYLQDLAGYWTAVFQLEQAVGVELR